VPTPKAISTASSPSISVRFFERDGTWGRIVAWSSRTEARGRGVGFPLVAAAESSPPAMDASGWKSPAETRPADAHKFYQRCGYADKQEDRPASYGTLPTSNDNQDQLLPES